MARGRSDATPATSSPDPTKPVSAGAASTRPVQTATPIGKPNVDKIRTFFGVLLAVGVVAFIVGAILSVAHIHPGQHTPEVTILANDSQYAGTYVVSDETATFNCSKPFLGLKVENIKAGDWIQIRATGKARWDQWSTRVGINEIATPDGAGYRPCELHTNENPIQFPVPKAGIASLVGIIGTECTWDDNAVPHVSGGTKWFAIGSALMFQSPVDGDLYLAMNERWTSPSIWNDNSGFWEVRVIVRR